MKSGLKAGAFGALSAVLLLGGCAVSDEGAVDYRKTSQVVPGENGALALRHKNFSLRNNAQIEEGNSLSVHLRTAFIKDFIELWGNPIRNGGKPNGEIAVVARVFEMGGGNDFDFGDQNMRAGRLVFYSSDVEKGQFLNFNNMPIYGPKTYSGAPLAIQIAVFEIDSGSSEQMKVLLKTLARAGAAAYAPASPILKILDGLGQSLLSGEQDDTIFRYTWVLDPNPGYAKIMHPQLEAGYYVLVREQERTKDTQWGGLRFQEDNGRLEKMVGGVPEVCKGLCEKAGVEVEGKEHWVPYRDGSYLVVEINKGLSSKDIDLAQNTYGTFLDTLKRKDVANAANLAPLTQGIIQATAERVQTSNFAAAKVLLSKVQNTSGTEQKVALGDLLEMLRSSMADGLTPLKDLSGVDDLEKMAPLSEPQVAFIVRRLKLVTGITDNGEFKKFIAAYDGTDIDIAKETATAKTACDGLAGTAKATCNQQVANVAAAANKVTADAAAKNTALSAENTKLKGEIASRDGLVQRMQKRNLDDAMASITEIKKKDQSAERKKFLADRVLSKMKASIDPATGKAKESPPDWKSIEECPPLSEKGLVKVQDELRRLVSSPAYGWLDFKPISKESNWSKLRVTIAGEGGDGKPEEGAKPDEGTKPGEGEKAKPSEGGKPNVAPAPSAQPKAKVKTAPLKDVKQTPRK